MNPFRKTDKFSYLQHSSPFENDTIFDDSLFDSTYYN